MSRSRLRTALLPLTASLVFAGCAAAGGSTPPGSSPADSTPAGSAASGASASPQTDRSASPSPAATPTGPSAVLDQGPLVLTPVTMVQNDRPNKNLVKPKCAQPGITIGPTAMSPAGTPKNTAWPADRLVKPGTNHAAIAQGYAYPAKQVFAWMNHKAPQPKKKIAFLTFDDGPNGVTTPQIMRILRDEKVPATFFVVARQIGEFNATLVQQQIAEGHSIAIHSYGHHYRYLYPGGAGSPENVSCDIDWAVAAVQSAVGKQFATTAYRYPGGHQSWKRMGPTDAMLAKRGMSYIDWNSMDGDADSSVPHSTTQDMIANVQRTARGYGADKDNVLVVLMHDYHPNPLTTNALPAIIKDLRKRGYSFGVIS
ncbi:MULTISPECIES: polysaccharide deacetylase family protein [unclassified Luteococcus]|uniref:polysaccharide deacetylase family protein n=1 Tax=unclassified Luteococcus TaxID=2639923 RepID=UPI00313BD3D9